MSEVKIAEDLRERPRHRDCNAARTEPQTMDLLAPTTYAPKSQTEGDLP